MRFPSSVFFFGIVFALLFAMSRICAAGNSIAHDCVSFDEASKHVGASQCVRGTVLHVETVTKGVTVLNFCKEAKACPFTVVVFPADLKKMGDVRQLEGQQIEIKGTIQDYDGRAQIILRRTKQLGEGAFLLFPMVPTEYDVERAGHSAAKAKRYKPPKAKNTKEEEPVPLEEAGEPQ
jgi:DNA/RNA endonuclease YhcR with UshA esterase domain